MRRFVLAFLLCLALAVFHTWPIAAAPHRHSLNYNADAELNAWIVSWIAYALPHEPQRLFAGNIFQPDDRVLAYSEPLVVPALIGAPIRWMGGSAVLDFNLLLLAGLAGTALAGWWAVHRWTGSFAAGLTAGALLAFNTHLLTRLPHLQAAHAWGLVLVFYLVDRLLAIPSRPSCPSRPSLRLIVALAVAIASVAVTSLYWLFFAGLLVLVQGTISARSARSIGRVAAAGVLAGVLALPVLLPYIRLAREGVRRPLEQAAQLSATPSAYLVSSSLVDATWSRRFFTRDIDVLFPGFIAMGLAAVGATASCQSGGPARRRVVALVVVAMVGFLLSLGPSTPVYRVAYHAVLPLQGLRVPARFGYLPLFAVALSAGFGVAALERLARARAAAAVIGIVSVAAVTIEAWHGPVHTTPFTGVPPIYSLVDREPKPALLVEAPFWPAEAAFGNAEYVLNATGHRTPIMNGYSGYTPDDYRRRAQWFWFFPERWAIDAMRHEGATHVMVHLEQFGAEAESVRTALASQRDLELISRDGAGHILYRFSVAAR
jgi:hypothetical protein